jgi:hypothetical protein
LVSQPVVTSPVVGSGSLEVISVVSIGRLAVPLSDGPLASPSSPGGALEQLAATREIAPIHTARAFNPSTPPN